MTADERREGARTSTLDPGMTFEGVDALDAVTSRLAAGRTVSDAQWETLYTSPGYRYYLGPDARRSAERRERFASVVQLVFSPDQEEALQAKLDEPQGQLNMGDRTFFALLAFKNNRDALRQARKRFESTDLLTAAFRDAAAYVPSSVSMDSVARPPISFVVYNLDGRATPDGEIVIDHVFAVKQGIDGFRRFLAHEVHHFVRSRLSKLTRPGPEVPEADIVKTVDQLQAEGIADHIDKPQVVFSDELMQQFEDDSTHAGQWMAAAFQQYGRAFRSEYESTPATLARIDSLLIRAARADEQGDADALREHAGEMWNALAFAGHPNGFYMARHIEDVRTVVANPFEFVYRYNDAVCGSDAEAHCFSDDAIRYLRTLENRHYDE